MDKMVFTSRLTLEDIRRFLVKYGGFMDCIIHDSFCISSDGIIVPFSHRGLEYELFAEDFAMRVVNLQDVEEGREDLVRPSSDDWFCFLKGKFRLEYQLYYASLFDAEDLIFGHPLYISQISFYEFIILIKSILGYRKGMDTASLEITEVESFFRSERRFYVEGPYLEKPFYLRVCDFQIIQPRTLSYHFRVIMEKMFGEEYQEAYKRTFKNMLRPDITLQEFVSKEEPHESTNYC